MLERYAGTLLGFVVGAMIAHCAASAHGTDRTYADALAAVAVNENDFRATPVDIALHHQAASFHADDSPGRLRWLRRHSRRVLGDRECRAQRNCRWSRQLWADPLSRPDALAPGAWSPHRWERIRSFAKLLADGEVVLEPCPIPIISWGAPGDFEEGGLVPVECGSRNLGATTRRIYERHRPLGLM